MDRRAVEGSRVRGGTGGHYESYFFRANHPSKPLAFWVRFTMLARRGAPAGEAIAERWAVWSDGERGSITAVRDEVPLARARFDAGELRVQIGESACDGRSLAGSCASHGHAVSWDLAYEGRESPLLLLPERAYELPVPKAKALTISPLATFEGTVTVDGEPHAIERWVGSSNHNWGSRHTDEYAWGQVMGFDDAPASYLEVSTARVQIGPARTPWLSPAVLHHEGERYAFNDPATIATARARYDARSWTLETRARGCSLRVQIDAPPEAFVALPYGNPPGGTKWCSNSKLASCELTLERRGRGAVRLRTKHRAAFEQLRDAPTAGLRRLGDA